MPQYADGENNFSDDDLDDLPLNALAELENNAIESTQAAFANSQLLVPPLAPPNQIAAPSSDYGDDFDDEDFDDAVVIDESRSTAAILPSLGQHDTRPSRPQYNPLSQHNTPRYGSNASASLNNRSRPNVPQFQPPIRNNALPLPQERLPPRFSEGSQPTPALDNPAELFRQLEEAITSHSKFLQLR